MADNFTKIFQADPFFLVALALSLIFCWIIIKRLISQSKVINTDQTSPLPIKSHKNNLDLNLEHLQHLQLIDQVIKLLKLGHPIDEVKYRINVEEEYLSIIDRYHSNKKNKN